MARRDDDREESPLYIALIMLGACAVLTFLVWIVASNRIVFGSLGPALAVGAMWKLFDSNVTIGAWNSLVVDAQRFAVNPTDVSVFEWATFIMTAFRPLTIVLGLLYLGSLVFIGFRGRKTLTRKISPDDLIAMSTKHFTGIAPVVSIRKQIAEDKHPKWRRQVAPEDVFLNFKVPKTKIESTGSLAKTGMPMIREGKFDREVARAYFIGADELLPDGRLVSRMLGRQIVNLPTDAKKAKSIVFPDRMSSEGKVLLALWSAVAFGGPKGRDEYWEYRDKLNLSAFGTADGIANLAVAQPLYEKYRKNAMVNKLFAIHHWENTFLFALLALAQKKGRYTTAEILWLRPLNRVMFFALNTRGSYTPHTEAATTFAQHAYENACAKLNRLPLMQDEKGLLTHVIYIDKAVDGLELECARWFDADEADDDDWWAKKNIWQRAEPTIDKSFKQLQSTVPVQDMPGVTAETAFDKSSSAAAAAAAASESAGSPPMSPELFAQLLAGSNGKS